MTQPEAEAMTGVIAREIVATNESAMHVHNDLIAIGDQFRFQLGRTVSHTARVPFIRDGKPGFHTVNTTAFELQAFGSSFEEAVTRLLRKRQLMALKDAA